MQSCGRFLFSFLLLVCIFTTSLVVVKQSCEKTAPVRRMTLAFKAVFGFNQMRFRVGNFLSRLMRTNARKRKTGSIIRNCCNLLRAVFFKTTQFLARETVRFHAPQKNKITSKTAKKHLKRKMKIDKRVKLSGVSNKRQMRFKIRGLNGKRQQKIF